MVLGQAWIQPIPFEKTDHLWILLTDPEEDSLAVIVMLTDARNIVDAKFRLPEGYNLTEQFTLTKESTIDFSRAIKREWPVVRAVLEQSPENVRGVVSVSNVTAIRRALAESPLTPADVLSFAEARGW